MVDFEQKDKYSVADLLRIMEILRAPDGCMWDRAQDHHSIRQNFIEETYEVCEAIDDEDTEHLKEELGDVLLQVVFHAQMEKEKGVFDMDDVADGICKKLIFRHPHIFGDVTVGSTDEILSNWDDLKRKEKKQETDTSTLESVSKSLPSLIRAQKLQKKAAKVGIGWTFFILMFAVLVSVVAHLFLGDGQESSTIFIAIVRRIFTGPWLGLISGLLLSAILAGAMSTADSQLLAASSAFASDVYKPVIRKGQSTDKEMLWVGRIVVLVIAAAALLIASNPGSGTIMSLVENAWGIFGASFGPVIVLSLFWRGFTFSGAAAGIVAGAVVDVLWLVLFKSTGVYEIVPGFAAGLLAAVIASKCSSAESRETAAALFDQCIAYKD